ncbi:unnamed protein product, partial [Dicrocoelium dendriticum]
MARLCVPFTRKPHGMDCMKTTRASSQPSTRVVLSRHCLLEPVEHAVPTVWDRNCCSSHKHCCPMEIREHLLDSTVTRKKANQEYLPCPAYLSTYSTVKRNAVTTQHERQVKTAVLCTFKAAKLCPIRTAKKLPIPP